MANTAITEGQRAAALPQLTQGLSFGEAGQSLTEMGSESRGMEEKLSKLSIQSIWGKFTVLNISKLSFNIAKGHESKQTHFYVRESNLFSLCSTHCNNEIVALEAQVQSLQS